MRAGSSISVAHWPSSRNRAVVELLERLALAHFAGDLADEQDQRRGVLVAMCMPADALVAPGPRVTKHMPGRPVALPPPPP